MDGMRSACLRLIPRCGIVLVSALALAACGSNEARTVAPPPATALSKSTLARTGTQISRIFSDAVYSARQLEGPSVNPIVLERALRYDARQLDRGQRQLYRVKV